MNDAHAQEIQTIFNALNSSKKGLSSIEAKKKDSTIWRKFAA